MPGMPFNATAADVREAIRGVLASWGGLVVEQRRVAPPPRTVPALAGFLVTHVDWMAAHETATEVTDEVTELVRSARHVAYPEPARRVPVGACVEAGCSGELSTLVRPGEALLPPEISCDADPTHRWHAHQWMQLSRRISAAPVDPAPTRWLSAMDISRLWAIPSGTVYRLANEQGWRRRSRVRRTYYQEVDVQHTFDQRESRSNRKVR